MGGLQRDQGDYELSLKVFSTLIALPFLERTTEINIQWIIFSIESGQMDLAFACIKTQQLKTQNWKKKHILHVSRNVK